MKRFCITNPVPSDRARRVLRLAASVVLLAPLLSAGGGNGPVSAATSTVRVGIVRTDASSTVQIQDDPYGSNWGTLPSSAPITQMAMSGARVGIVTNDGNCWARESTSTPWVLLANTCIAIELSGSRAGVLKTVNSGTLYIKDGALDTGGVNTGFTSPPSSDHITQFSMSGSRIGIATTNGTCWGRDVLSGSWIIEADGCVDIRLSGNRIGIISWGNGGTIFIKDGALDTGGMNTGFATFTGADHIAQFVLEGNRIAATTTSQVCLARDSLTGSWTQLANSCTNTQLSGNRIGILKTNGTISTKDGLTGSWSSPSGADHIGRFRLATVTPNVTAVRAGIVRTDATSTVQFQDEPYGSNWASLPSSAPITQMAMDAERIGIVTNDGNCWARESTSSPWVLIANSCTAIGLSGTRLGVLTTANSGTLYIKDGALDTGGVNTGLVSPPSSDHVVQFSLDGSRIGIATTSGMCSARDVLAGAWTIQADGCVNIQLSGSRIAIISAGNGGTIYIKDGALNTGGMNTGFSTFTGADHIAQLVLEGTRIAGTTTTQTCVARDSLSGSWTQLATSCTNVQLEGNQIGYLTTTNSGTLNVRTGLTGSASAIGGADHIGLFRLASTATAMPLRFQLSWTGVNDLDLRVNEPSANMISSANPGPSTTGGAITGDSGCGGSGSRSETVGWNVLPWLGNYTAHVEQYDTCGGASAAWTLKVIKGSSVVATYSGTGTSLSDYTYNYAGA